MAFDGSYLHEVWSDTGGVQVVLLIFCNRCGFPVNTNKR
jgi:hypothetical protein